MKTIGVMTGNSLDGVDAVLTDFSGDKITDIASEVRFAVRAIPESGPHIDAGYRRRF